MEKSKKKSRKYGIKREKTEDEKMLNKNDEKRSQIQMFCIEDLVPASDIHK